MAAIASSEFIVTLAELKLHLNISNTDNDSWLDSVIAQTTKKIQTFCNRSFKAAQYTEYHNGTGKRGFIYVDNPPVVAISELNEDVNRDFGASTKFATNQYITYDEEGKIELLNVADVLSTSLNPVVFGAGQKNIKLVYTGGYSAMPEDVKLGCLEWIAKIHRRRDGKRWGITNKTKGDVSTTYEVMGVMPEDVREYLAPYRLIKFGKRI